MSIQSEYDALLKFWKKRGFVGRVFLCCGFMCSLLSIVSLGDAVFKFKGVVVYAADLYGQISEIVAGWLNVVFGFHVPAEVVGVISASMISWGVIRRFVRRDSTRQAREDVAAVLDYVVESLNVEKSKKIDFKQAWEDSGGDRSKLPDEYLATAYMVASLKRRRRIRLAYVVLLFMPPILYHLASWVILLFPFTFVAMSAICLDEFVWLRDPRRVRAMMSSIAIIYFLAFILIVVSEGLVRVS